MIQNEIEIKDRSNRNLFVVIPAYQPDEALIHVVDDVRGWKFEDPNMAPPCEVQLQVIVVDDGSGTNYRDVFGAVSGKSMILRHEKNRGKGAALKTAFQYIQKESTADNDVVVLVDADGQHNPEDAKQLALCCMKDPKSLWLGERHFVGDIPFRSKFGNRVTEMVFGLSTGVHLEDTQTGLRAFAVSLLPVMMTIPGDRYEYEMNMLLFLAKQKISIQGMPIETRYEAGNPSSHFHPVRDSIRIYKEILRFGASSFVSFLADYALYSIFNLAGLSVVTANIIARIISATLNFTLNRTLVFKHKDSVAKSGLKYAALAVTILIIDTALVRLLTTLHLSPFAAKLIAEPLMFLFSWAAQRLFVFAVPKNRKGDSEAKDIQSPEIVLEKTQSSESFVRVVRKEKP